MRETVSFLKLILVFATVFSLVGIHGPLGQQSLLAIPRVQAVPAPVEPWYPAGPAMDTLVYKIYTDSFAEFTDLQVGGIDIPDWPLPPSQIQPMIDAPNFYITPPISDTGYFELQFHLGSDFWGCTMNFGNSACGREIRQAFAHSLDKVKFTSLQSSLAGVSVPIDNPVPPVVDLVLPNPCGWDTTHVQSGSNCVVGEGGTTGGVAYHLAPAVACGLSSCPSAPSRPWTPGLGTPDFCAGADHLVAAGLATGKMGGPGTGTCVLTGVSSTAAASPVNIFVRSDDNRRLQGGLSVAEFVCALFTGSFSETCPPYLATTQGPITIFPGFTTSPTTVEQDWNVYTGGFAYVLTFDSSQFFSYESRFVSGIPSIKQSGGGPCSNDAYPSFSPSNYVYLCDQTYDSLITSAAFASCLSTPSDPINGQSVPTFADCPGSTQLSATSASYQSQDEFGKNAFTVPWWSGRHQFAYATNWQRVVLHKGNGFTPPGNIPADFNAWSPNPTVPGTVRQGYAQSPTSLNPYVSSSSWDDGVTRNVWDSPTVINPDSPQSTLDWMTVSTQVLSNAQLTYVPMAGTLQTYRYTLRNDIFWQTGQKVTAWDLAFSYISFKVTGTPPGVGLVSMSGVKVLSPTQMDINIDAFGPFTQFFLSSGPVLPGRFWSSCGTARWDAGVSNTDFAAANAALTPCIGSSVTSSGVILPYYPGAVDYSKILPSFDPVAAGIMVGSGPWVCKSPLGIVGTGCSSSGTQEVSPGGTITLTRNGFGIAPGASLDTYFRSSGNLALWAWSGNTGNFNHDFLNFGVASLCFGVSPVPLSCSRWSMGIGNPSGSSSSPATVGLTQIGIVQRFVGINWVSPYDWLHTPPQGIAAFPPFLHEGLVTLNPAGLVGCSNSFNNGGGYDC